MNIKQAKKLVVHYQKWRRGGDGDTPDARQLGIAIDVLLAAPEKRYTELSQKLISFALGGQEFFCNAESAVIEAYCRSWIDVLYARCGDEKDKTQYAYYLLMVAEELSW